MPTYEYKCKKCGHAFSLVLRIAEHEAEKPKCPKCRSNEIEQRISLFFA